MKPQMNADIYLFLIGVHPCQSVISSAFFLFDPQFLEKRSKVQESDFNIKNQQIKQFKLPQVFLKCDFLLLEQLESRRQMQGKAEGKVKRANLSIAL